MRTSATACWSVVLVVVLAACVDGRAESASDPTVRATVVAGGSVTLEHRGRHLTVLAAADAIPPGALTVQALRPADLDPAPVHDPVSITIGGPGPVVGDLELRYDLPDKSPSDAVVAYLDEQQNRWMPVPTVRTGDDLVATVGHLTTFGWFDDLRLVVGDFVGTRAGPPTCASSRPDWVRDLITTQGADAQVFACAESSGPDVKVRVANNRAYPVLLHLSAAPASRRVDPAWPESVRDFIARVGAALDDGGSGVAMPPLGTVELLYAQPQEPTLVTGFVRVGLPTALLTVILNSMIDLGLIQMDPVINGKPLGLSTVDCLLSTLSGIHDLTTRDQSTIAGGVRKFAACALEIVSAERNSLVLRNDGDGVIAVKGDSVELFKKLSVARDLLKFYSAVGTAAKFVAQVTDVALDLRPDIRDGVDVTVDLRGVDVVVLTPTSVAGVQTGGPAKDAETKLRQKLGPPTGSREYPGCSLSDPRGDGRRQTSWGSLDLITGTSGTSRNKLVGWILRPGPFPGAVRLPYKVSTSTSVRDAIRLIPDAVTEWNPVFEMFTITTQQAPGMIWSGDREDSSGNITLVTNAFEPCE